MKQSLLCASLLSVRAAVNTGNYPIDETLVDTLTETVHYEANTNFKICTCDMTANSCDPHCCCDQDCSQVSSLNLN